MLSADAIAAMRERATRANECGIRIHETGLIVQDRRLLLSHAAAQAERIAAQDERIADLHQACEEKQEQLDCIKPLWLADQERIAALEAEKVELAFENARIVSKIYHDWGKDIERISRLRAVAAAITAMPHKQTLAIDSALAALQPGDLEP